MTFIHRIALHHGPFWLGTLAGIAAFLLAPAHWSVIARVLTGWNIGVGIFLLLLYPWMRRFDSRQMEARFREDDPTAPVILLIVTVAALLSLVAIVALLGGLKHSAGGNPVAHIVLAAITVAVSWVLVATMFAMHYADLYYSVPADEAPLAFPGDERPVFSDFLYFSFTIAAACQTSDVATLRTAIRRAVTAHTIVSFVFNVSILGFAINVTAGLLGSG
ncbi:MAG: DUF1345 domain-containing protein [Steroidobacteraceae bacterium]